MSLRFVCKCLLMWMCTLLHGSVFSQEAEVNCSQNPTQRLFKNENLQAIIIHPEGKKILLLDGGIDDNAEERVRVALERNAPLDEVWFNSPGGSSQAGIDIAYLLRGYGVITRVPAGNWCISACTSAFLGGVIRNVDEGGFYAIHSFTGLHDKDLVRIAECNAKLLKIPDRILVDQGFESVADEQQAGAISQLCKIPPSELKEIKIASFKTGESVITLLLRKFEQKGAQLANIQADFMLRMGVSRKLLTLKFKQAASGYRCLTQQELRSFNVTNAY